MRNTKSKKKDSKNLIRHIEAIATKAKNSKFTDQFIREVLPDARIIAPYLNCNTIQAILFSVIFNLNFKYANVAVDELADYMDCSPVTVVSYFKDLEILINKKVLRKYKDDDDRPRRRHSTCLDKLKFYVNHEILETVSKEEVFVPGKPENLDMYDILDEADRLFNQRDNGLVSFDEMIQEIDLLLSENRKLMFVKELRNLKLEDNDDFLMLLYICHEFTDNEEEVDLLPMIKTIFPDMKRQLAKRKSFLEGRNQLQVKELVSLEDGSYVSDRTIRLTDKAIDLLFAEDKVLFRKKKENKKLDVVYANDIPRKTLYFGKTEQSELAFLENALLPQNFNALCERMKQEKLQQGFTVLFYGSPGTGKTESVYQLARKTGRDIKSVVISETKSMWFGQSERLIKGVFDDYRKMAEHYEITPILLFNEADGIFSTRKQIGSSNVDQTENAIQNIILQEMENFTGILVATTNLTQNLDKAFERRFLYKVHFDKPSLESKFRIWKYKIPSLTSSEVRILAERFDFSGGQIDNIARKYLMKQVLYGSDPDLTELEVFCSEEELAKGNYSRIGFLH